MCQSNTIKSTRLDITLLVFFAISTPGAVPFDVITPELERLRISFAQVGFLFVGIHRNIHMNAYYYSKYFRVTIYYYFC